MSATDTAIIDVRQERFRQDTIHGDNAISRSNDPFRALAVLMEEVGELSTAIQMLGVMPTDATDDEVASSLHEMREEAVQVAACAVAIIEAIDNDQYP
jgi:NTP pyrophosphatase (non-canonical NTP hydrolase)